MMRSWFRNNARTLVLVSAVISVATHAAVIAAWVLGTLPAPELPRDAIANHVFYIPPPDRVVGREGNRESITYVKVDAPGLGSGEGARMMGEARPTTADQTAGRATAPSPDSVTAERAEPAAGRDSVFSVLEVDTAVARMASSAAPAYPLSLLKAHVEGYVNARYIVDTTGFADTASFVVLQATNPLFVTAVREALPFMRFQPAKIGAMKVKQLVQQQFSFKITDTLPPTKRP